MASLSRPSAKVPSGAAPTQSKAEVASFHGSRFFEVLGRIDEESSFRVNSLSNMTSQDSSPRSSHSSDDSSEGADWFSPLIPETFSTEINNKRNPLAGGNYSNNNNNSNTNNHSITVVTSITNVDDPKMNVAVSAEHRQDRSSPTPLNSRTASSSQYSSPLQDNRGQQLQLQLQLQHQQQQQQHQQKAMEKEQIKRDNKALRKKCEELEAIILQMRTEGNILQTRTALKIQSYRTEIEKAIEVKQRREQQCRELEDQIWKVRTETQLRQEDIWAAEAKLRKQQKP